MRRLQAVRQFFIFPNGVLTVKPRASTKWDLQQELGNAHVFRQAAADQKKYDRGFWSLQQILQQCPKRIGPQPHVRTVGHLVRPSRQHRLQLVWGTGGVVGLPTADDLRLVEPSQYIFRCAISNQCITCMRCMQQTINAAFLYGMM